MNDKRLRIWGNGTDEAFISWDDMGPVRVYYLKYNGNYIASFNTPTKALSYFNQEFRT